MGRLLTSTARVERVDWVQLLPEAEWRLYKAVLQGVRASRLRFALGGELAFSAYARRWRRARALDLYVLPKDRAEAVAVLTHVGFADYHDEMPHNSHGSYRGRHDGVLVDVIWQMANGRADVDEVWLTQGRQVMAGGLALRLLAPEELIWSKLYVLQRDHCDWPDLLSLLFALGPLLDWEHLLWRVGDDAPVLGGLLSLFRWLCPERARWLPAWVWARCGVSGPLPGPACEDDPRRAALLDGRDWFGPKAAEVGPREDFSARD